MNTFDEYVAHYRTLHRDFFEDPYSARIEPFRIYGPLYYVGDRAVCVHLIDTGDGLVLIDAGFTHTVPMLLESIIRLGFDPKDVKTVILTHGHFDHMGAAEYFRKMYGAKIAISRVDAELVRTKDDFALTALCAPVTPLFRAPVEYDILFEDGDVYTLGNLSISLKLVPGHTPGVLAFFFDVTENGQAYRAGLLGGIGLAAIHPYFLRHFGLPMDLPLTMQKKVDELRSEHVDIHLGNHPNDNRILAKRELELTTGEKTYVNPTDWQEFLTDLGKRIDKVPKEQ